MNACIVGRGLVVGMASGVEAVLLLVDFRGDVEGGIGSADVMMLNNSRMIDFKSMYWR